MYCMKCLQTVYWHKQLTYKPMSNIPLVSTPILFPCTHGTLCNVVFCGLADPPNRLTGLSRSADCVWIKITAILVVLFKRYLWLHVDCIPVDLSFLLTCKFLLVFCLLYSSWPLKVILLNVTKCIPIAYECAYKYTIYIKYKM